jgi:polyphosphate kinase
VWAVPWPPRRSKQQTFCAAYFEREVFPVLTPLAFDPSRPFRHIFNLSINLAVMIHASEAGELFARLKVPAALHAWCRSSVSTAMGRATSQPNASTASSGWSR